MRELSQHLNVFSHIFLTVLPLMTPPHSVTHRSTWPHCILKLTAYHRNIWYAGNKTKSKVFFLKSFFLQCGIVEVKFNLQTWDQQHLTLLFVSAVEKRKKKNQKGDVSLPAVLMGWIIHAAAQGLMNLSGKWKWKFYRISDHMCWYWKTCELEPTHLIRQTIKEVSQGFLMSLLIFLASAKRSGWIPHMSKKTELLSIISKKRQKCFLYF